MPNDARGSRRCRTLLAGAVLTATVGAASARAQAPRLDHAVIVVPSLDTARARLSALGFRLKAGRLHASNLLNLHVKFPGGTALELMTLAGPPGDAMARGYADLLADGPGGAYIALAATDLDRVAAAADRVGLSYRRSRAGSWRFLSFPAGSEAGAVFLGSGWAPAADPDSVLAHPNGASALVQAWVEGGPRLEALLEALGTAPGDSVRLPDGRAGRAWRLAAGTLVIVRPRPGRLSRPVGVVVAAHGAAAPVQTFPRFWIGLALDAEPPIR